MTMMNTYLAWHTTGVGWKCQPVGFHWEAHKTVWTRHRWHTGHGYTLSSSTQFSGSKQKRSRGFSFCFFTFFITLIPLYINSWTAEITHSTDLCLLFGELHVVEDAKDNSEKVVPPVLLEGVTVTLHNLKHDCETSVRRNGKRQFYCIMEQPEQNCYCL